MDTDHAQDWIVRNTAAAAKIKDLNADEVEQVIVLAATERSQHNESPRPVDPLEDQQ